MITQWFLNQDEEISGPFSTEEIQHQISLGISPEILIWGRSQEDWKTLSWWKQSLPHLLKSGSRHIKEEVWHLAHQGKSQGPLSRKELIESLKQMDSQQDVMLWTKGMKAWLPLFDFHDVMEELGIGRRKSPRAQLSGTVTISGGLVAGIGQLRSISEGGLGVVGIPGGVPGQELSLEINADTLGEPIRAKAEIRYVTESGYYGLKFTQISMEAKSSLIDYIRHHQSQPLGNAA